LRFLKERHGRVSYERVVSGMGISAIYEYLVATHPGQESAAVRKAIEEEKDDPAVISRFCKQGDPLCVKCMDIFAGVYGAEAGNVALKVIATGGVYLTGGIGPKNLEKMKDGTFLTAYTTKGRFSPLVESMPLRLVINKNVGLLGAAAAALELEQL
jgi:glucokinase